MGVLFDDSNLTGEINGVFADQTSPESSYRVMPRTGKVVWQDGTRTPAKMLDSEPAASIWRRITAVVIGLLPIESQL
jgi:putative cardiolipin synthase